MSRPTSQTPSSSALRMRKHLERRRQGLEPLPQPWHWLTAGEAREMALQAFRAASWERRDGTPGDFADAVVGAFAVLVHAQAERAGLGLGAMCDPVAEARQLVEAVPAEWRHQYPRFQEAQ